MKIHHIGYLTKDIQKAIETFTALGYTLTSPPIYDRIRDIQICFMELDGYQVELVAPCSEQSVVYDLLKKQGAAPYHICYIVSDIEEAISELRKKKFVQTQKPELAPAIEDKKVVFLYHKTMGIIELLEENENGKRTKIN